MMDINTYRGDKGISSGEWRHKTMLLPRNRLSDITNLSIGDFGHELFKNDPENGKTGSPVMVNEYIAKLLKENNVLMRALAERNTEVQNLRLMVAKQNQQNCQLAQAHSQMLAELNLSRDRLKAAQHELGCTSTVLKLKSQELEEQKKSHKQNMRIQNMQEGRIKPAETAVETSRRPSRKRPHRTQSLMPMPVPNQTTAEETRNNGNCYSFERKIKSRRRLSNVESAVPTEDLFEIEDAKFPMCSGENEREEEVKDGGCSAPTIPIKSVKEIQLPSGSKRASLGRPLRRAAEKINCYKEMPLNSKLRRSE